MTHSAPDAHVEQYSLILGARGRLVLPAPVRARLGMKAGDRLVLTEDADGTLRLMSQHAQVERLEGAYRHLANHSGGASLVDELIAERHAEAEREARAHSTAR